MEGREKKQVWAEEVVKMPCRAMTDFTDPMGSSGARMALQSYP